MNIILLYKNCNGQHAPLSWLSLIVEQKQYFNVLFSGVDVEYLYVSLSITIIETNVNVKKT